ncbi:hypothetical protein B0H65DRAFT_227503 [Neurospora tetraspora]|uniref:Uncharacterized protein n=1 Tax=Neurospora tetraspora TaxID=94610 RepID=A0AAE0JDC9_9PEZI|nr:hypothetical protein B0H65DRAFT_227503 [Neurospora tetraspora]
MNWGMQTLRSPATLMSASHMCTFKLAYPRTGFQKGRRLVLPTPGPQLFHPNLNVASCSLNEMSRRELRAVVSRGQGPFAPSFSGFHPCGLAAVSVRAVVSRVGIRQQGVGRNPAKEAEAGSGQASTRRTRVARSFDSFVSHSLTSYRADISMLVSGQRHAYLYSLPCGFACSRRKLGRLYSESNHRDLHDGIHAATWMSLQTCLGESEAQSMWTVCRVLISV